MANLGEKYGAAPDRVALAHSLRMLLVVTIFPVAITLAGFHATEDYHPVVTPFDAIVSWKRKSYGPGSAPSDHEASAGRISVATPPRRASMMGRSFASTVPTGPASSACRSRRPQREAV